MPPKTRQVLQAIALGAALYDRDSALLAEHRGAMAVRDGEEEMASLDEIVGQGFQDLLAMESAQTHTGVGHDSVTFARLLRRVAASVVERCEAWRKADSRFHFLPAASKAVIEALDATEKDAPWSDHPDIQRALENSKDSELADFP